MVKQMLLRCKIHRDGEFFVCSSWLYDGVPFSFNLLHDLPIFPDQPITAENQPVDGYVMVQQESQQKDICYLTLPGPSIVHGHQVTVKALQLKDVNQVVTKKKAAKKDKETSGE